MAPNRHSSQSELDQKRTESQSNTDSNSSRQGKSAPAPSSNQSPQSEIKSHLTSEEILRIKEMELELQEKQQLVTTLTEQLTQVSEQLDHSLRARKISAATEDIRLKAMEEELLKELGEERQEKEQLVESLKENLVEIAEQLELSQRTNEELSAAEILRVQEMEAEFQEKEQLVSNLKENLAEIAEQLENSQRTNEELSAAEMLRVQELEAKLQEKEQLVSSLNENLAEIAEQLENTQRTNEELSAAEMLRVQELEAELQEKEQLVSRLNENLAEIAEQLKLSQHNNNELSAAEILRVQELEAELHEKEQLVSRLNENLAEIAEQLEISQRTIEELSAAEMLRVQELETELQEKEQLVSSLNEKLAEITEQLEISQRTNEKLTAADKQRVQELELELEEKEQLVVVLTERLEQVAEQLDRRHRTGADRGMTISGGIPQEVIEEQQKLSQDLNTVLEQFQGMETESSLTRIELQIAELKQLVESGFANGSVAPKPSSLVDYLGSPSLPGAEKELLSQEEEAGTLEEPSASAPMDDASASGWEAMKEKLLSGQGVDVSTDLTKNVPTPPPPVPVQQEAPQNLVAEQSDVSERTLGSYKPPLPEAPAAVDYAQASQDQLAQAINERDQYISLLIKRVREAETAVIPVNWEQLNNVPEALIEKVQSLHHDLEHNLGMAEVEISIERAKLSRTESMLQNREAQIRKKEKQLGLNLERSEEAVVEENELDDDRKKNWLGFLN